MNRPVLIGIGGSQSNVGKTTFAVALLKYLTKINDTKWGAIKYTKTGSLPSIVIDKEILMEKGKDTWKLLNAGASSVAWIKSPHSKLNSLIPKALKQLSGLDGIIIEGNSAIEFLKPDIVIFIFGGDKKSWKSGTVKLIGKANIILYEKRDVLPKTNISALSFQKSFLDKRENRKIIMAVNKLIDDTKLKKELLKKAVNKKLTCSSARKIAEELNIPYKKVGKAADDLDIRIKNCQLGCF